MKKNTAYEKQLESRIEELEKIIEQANCNKQESIRDKLAFKIVDYMLDDNQLKNHCIEHLVALKPWKLADTIIEGKGFEEDR